MITFLLGFLSLAAFAQEPDLNRARELFENGRILYDEGSYEQAIVAWEEAYRLSQKPELYYNISGAYEKLGRYREAVDSLDQYRAMAPAGEREALDRRIRALEERMAAAPAPAPAPAPVVVAPAPVVEERNGVPVGPVILLGAGAVGLGIGGVTGLQAGAALGDVRETCVEGNAGLVCPSTAEPAVDKHRSASTVSAISLGAGGALAVTGAIWLAVGSGDGDVQVAPWLGATGLTIAGGF